MFRSSTSLYIKEEKYIKQALIQCDDNTFLWIFHKRCRTMIFARRSSHTPLTMSRIVPHDPNAISNLVTFQIIHAEPAFQFSLFFRPSVYSSLSFFHPRRTSASVRTVKKSEIVILKFAIQILSLLMLFFIERVYRIFERDTRNRAATDSFVVLVVLV